VSDWSNEPTQVEPRKNFLFRWMGNIARWLRNFFALVGFLSLLLPVILVWSLLNLGESDRSGRAGSKESNKPFSLWIRLDGAIAEHEPEMGEALFRQLFAQEEGLYIPNVRSALRSAADDKLVKDLNLVIDGLSGSPADIEELHNILVDFKASGKPVTSWVAHMDNAALLISSSSDKVNLNPVSDVSLPGPAFSSTYFGDALRRLGVEMQIIRTGKFKNVFEPFISNEPSTESREALSAVERSMREQMVKLIAQGRKKQDSEVFLWLKESFFTPAKAKELGIVDELTYLPHVNFDSGVDRLLDDYMDDDSLSERLKRGYSLRPDEGLGFIEAVGDIVTYEDSERAITPDAMSEELFWALENNDVKAVVLRIASPGGRADVADYIWDKVRILNQKKPVIVSMGSVAASGGYYIAVGGSHIFADASTITGSIGVIGMLPNLEGMRDKWGVSFHTVTQSNRANILSGKKMTAQDQSYMQSTVEDVYRTFKSRVAAGRKISMDKIEQLAQGRIYTGQQAKENGLIDEIGDLKEAFQYAKKVAGLDPNKLYPIHRYEPPRLSAAECFSSLSKLRRCFRKHGSSLRSAIAEVVFDTKLDHVRTLRQVNDVAKRGGVIAVLPITPSL
jgi:protease IV